MKRLLTVILILFSLSCKKEGVAPVFPIADFKFSETSDGYIHFLNTSKNATKYFWTFGDGGPTSDGDEILRRYNSNGQYKVTLSAQDASGNANTISKNVTVTKAPTTGNMVIWTNISNQGKINIWIDERGQSTQITKFQTTNEVPACFTEGFVTATAAQGSYSFRAQSETGTKWSGSIIFLNGECRNLQLK